MAATMTKVSRMEVVALLKELKYVTADKWDDSRLLKTLQGFPELIKDSELNEPTTDEGKALLSRIVETLADGGELEIEGAHAGNGHTDAAPQRGRKAGANKGNKKGGGKKGTAMTTATKGRKAAGGKGKKGATAEKNGSIAKDFLGSRVGTALAKFNACLTNKPKSMKQITEESGVGWPPRNHFRKLLAEGKIQKNDDGYFVKRK